MNRLLTSFVALLFATSAVAQAPFPDVARRVNPKLIKVYGSGGFKGLPAYGSGIVISADGYALTASSHLIDTPDLRVHLSDGRRAQAKLIVAEPELDAALIKIEGVEDLPHFDLAQAASRPLATPGDWVLGFSNQFEIATRDEPMSVQRGVIAALGKLPLQRGVFDAPYGGDVYVLDAVTNNPGAAGGALTTRQGELLGLIGKEMRNALSNTWVNYAVPVQAKVSIRQGDQNVSVSLLEFVEKGIKGEYKPAPRDKLKSDFGGYHGIVLVPNVVERTPPFVEELLPGSPALKAGLRPDDLIVYVDGEPVGSVAAFNAAMSQVRPGAAVKLEVRRGDKLVGVEVKVEDFPKRKK